MRIRLLALLLSASALGPAVAAAAAPTPAPATAKTPAPVTKDAPADQYFGSFGMSPLSIRSTIGFLGRQYHYRTISDHDLLRKALITESALRVWRSRYPQDSWLAPTFFHLEQLYQAVQTEEARKHATAILKDVVLYFPNTKYGHDSRARLAAGFPPLVPESPLVAPSPSAAPAATNSPGTQEMPGSDETSPAPNASGTPLPGTSPASPSSPAPSPSPSAASPEPSASPK